MFHHFLFEKRSRLADSAKLRWRGRKPSKRDGFCPIPFCFEKKTQILFDTHESHRPSMDGGPRQKQNAAFRNSDLYWQMAEPNRYFRCRYHPKEGFFLETCFFTGRDLGTVVVCGARCHGVPGQEHNTSRCGRIARRRSRWRRGRSIPAMAQKHTSRTHPAPIQRICFRLAALPTTTNLTPGHQNRSSHMQKDIFREQCL